MNYLQMYANLAGIIGTAAVFSWFVCLAVFEKGSKRAKIVSLTVATTLSLLTLFCAAMAGLLS